MAQRTSVCHIWRLGWLTGLLFHMYFIFITCCGYCFQASRALLRASYLALLKKMIIKSQNLNRLFTLRANNKHGAVFPKVYVHLFLIDKTIVLFAAESAKIWGNLYKSLNCWLRLLWTYRAFIKIIHLFHRCIRIPALLWLVYFRRWLTIVAH